ncbi:small ribosomal subunit protein bS6m [Pelodytes ibericus]
MQSKCAHVHLLLMSFKKCPTSTKMELKPETVATLKRTIEALMERGAVIRNLESLGEKPLPYKISKHSQSFRDGGYFLVDFYSSPAIIPNMLEHLSRDIDVIRPTILNQEPKTEEQECLGIPPVDLEAKFRRRKK